MVQKMCERINLPLVSVVIPVYNRENTVAAAIDSVLDQTYENIEIIVVNDASTDNTENVLFDKYKDKIKYFKNEKNMGVSFSRNKGIENANGKNIIHNESSTDISNSLFNLSRLLTLDRKLLW